MSDISPKYPIYVISKGRWELRHTVKALELMKLKYHVVIEPQEYDSYAAVISPENILVLPFSNLGKGSIPARNWVWEHSLSIGAERHWILDDNIRDFYRLYKNKKLRCYNEEIFKACEDFTDRYVNVAISGMNYRMFAPAREKLSPFRLNTRIYSCILIKNDIPFRWRGRYNEDTDLSLRVLKAGYCTILFNAFLADKITTMTCKGGNTDQLYVQDKKTDGRYLMAKSLELQHPGVTKVVWKWGRWQHSVDYSSFKKNKLIRNLDANKSITYNMRVVTGDPKSKSTVKRS